MASSKQPFKVTDKDGTVIREGEDYTSAAIAGLPPGEYWIDVEGDPYVYRLTVSRVRGVGRGDA